MQQSLVLIKPDAIERNLIGKIIDKYESNDLTIKDIKKVKVSRDLAEKHYAEHSKKPFFEELITYITRCEIVAMIIEGPNAVDRVRQINGSTNPTEAKEGTIRAMYALSKGENSVHASDSVDNAQREIDLWFKNE